MTDISSDIWRIKRPETIYFKTGTQFPLKITSLIIIFLLSAHEDGGESAAKVREVDEVPEKDSN